MATGIAVLSLIWVFICVPLVALRPKVVFYSFLFATVFDSVLNGYIEQANNLGAPQSWRPGDLFFPMVLFSSLMVNRNYSDNKGLIHKCVIGLALLTTLAQLQGFVRDFQAALAFSRGSHIIAAVLFGLRYLNTRERVSEFMKVTTCLLLFMFVVHIAIRFGFYTPPLVTELGRVSTQLSGERGGVSLVPVLYLILMSMGTAQLAQGGRRWWWAMFLLLCGVAGALLSENRSMYVSVAVLALVTVVFVRGRLKATVVYGLVGVAAVSGAAALNFDIFARFREKYDKGAIVSPLETRDEVRGEELSSMLKSYAEEPIFLLTGRGVGAAHFLPGRNRQVFRSYYHCEYLMWLDRCGLLGFGALLGVMCGCVLRSYTLSRSDDSYCRFLGVMCLLLSCTIMVEGLFHPIYTHLRGGSLMMCFAVIMANWRSICGGAAYQTSGPTQTALYGNPYHNTVAADRASVLPTRSV